MPVQIPGIVDHARMVNNASAYPLATLLGCSVLKVLLRAGAAPSGCAAPAPPLPTLFSSLESCRCLSPPSWQPASARPLSLDMVAAPKPTPFGPKLLA